MIELAKTAALFALTAVAEIVGCYLPWLVLKRGQPWWLLMPAAGALAVFAWLLTLHPSAAGRTYAAYGGMYIAVALVWLWAVEGITPTRWDLAGATVALIGMDHHRAAATRLLRWATGERACERLGVERVPVTEAARFVGRR